MPDDIIESGQPGLQLEDDSTGEVIEQTPSTETPAALQPSETRVGGGLPAGVVHELQDLRTKVQTLQAQLATKAQTTEPPVETPPGEPAAPTIDEYLSTLLRSTPPAAQPEIPQTPGQPLAAQLAETFEQAGVDKNTAEKIAALTEQLAYGYAQTMAAPALELSASERSQRLFTQVATMKDPDGRPLSKEAAALWAIVPAQMSSDPRVAEVLKYAMWGFDRLHRKGPQAAPAPTTEPVHTERAGGAGRRSAPMDPHDQSLMKRLGLTEADYRKQEAKFTPGVTNVVEE